MLLLVHFNISDLAYVNVPYISSLVWISNDSPVKFYSYLNTVNYPRTFMTLINKWREREAKAFISVFRGCGKFF